MTWIIFWGEGQLGRALGFVLSERQIPYRSFSSRDLDIRKRIENIDVFKQLNTEVIVNAAAWTNVEAAESNYLEAQAVNVDGASHLALIAKQLRAVYFQVSTDYVFSGDGNTPWSESDLRTPRSVYGRTKAAGEDTVSNHYAEGAYIVRTAWLYSEWRKNFAKTMTQLALKVNSNTAGEPEIKVVNDQIGQPTSALDVAHQIVEIKNAKLPFGIYHATNAGEATWYEYAQEIFKYCKTSSDHLVAIKTENFTTIVERPKYSVLGHEGWKKLGINGKSVNPMRDWQEALRENMPAIITAVKEGK
jgi:dTDP-4-dehydrorhamnose reductase